MNRLVKQKSSPPKVKGEAVPAFVPAAPTVPEGAVAVVEGGDRVAAVSGLELKVNPTDASFVAALEPKVKPAGASFVCPAEASAPTAPLAGGWPKEKILLPAVKPNC